MRSWIFVQCLYLTSAVRPTQVAEHVFEKEKANDQVSLGGLLFKTLDAILAGSLSEEKSAANSSTGHGVVSIDWTMGCAGSPCLDVFVGDDRNGGNIPLAAPFATRAITDSVNYRNGIHPQDHDKISIKIAPHLEIYKGWMWHSVTRWKATNFGGAKAADGLEKAEQFMTINFQGTEAGKQQEELACNGDIVVDTDGCHCAIEVCRNGWGPLEELIAPLTVTRHESCADDKEVPMGLAIPGGLTEAMIESSTLRTRDVRGHADIVITYWQDDAKIATQDLTLVLNYA